MNNLLEILNKSVDYLEKRKIKEARLKVESILAEVLSMQRIMLYANFERELSQKEIAKIKEKLNGILKKDEYTYKKLTKIYIKDGVIDKELHDELFDIMKSQKHYFDSLTKVSPERKRLENPHSYKVDLSSDLIKLKYGLINKIKNV